MGESKRRQELALNAVLEAMAVDTRFFRIIVGRKFSSIILFNAQMLSLA